MRFGNAAANESAVDMNDFLPLGAEGTTPPNPRPGFGHLSDVSTSPSGSRTVWGTPAIVGTPDAAMAGQPRTAANDGWLKDMEVLEERGDPDLAFQMEALGVTEPAAATAAGAGAAGSSGPSGGGKKKKLGI